MFFQDPSLLQFQERLKEQQHQDNLPTLFGAKNIPKSSQLYSVLNVGKDKFLRGTSKIPLRKWGNGELFFIIADTA